MCFLPGMLAHDMHKSCLSRPTFSTTLRCAVAGALGKSCTQNLEAGLQIARENGCADTAVSVHFERNLG
jgi:hypothetical protein